MLQQRPCHHDRMINTFNFTAFKQYLEGIAGGNRSSTTSTSIVRNAQRFHNVVTPGGENFLNSTIVFLKQLELYYSNLKKTIESKPTITAEKLRR